jgi:hypothetical protein
MQQMCAVLLGSVTSAENNLQDRAATFPVGWEYKLEFKTKVEAYVKFSEVISRRRLDDVDS